MNENKINPIAEQSREMFISALFELLEKKPYSQITISDIASQAQLARRTFYRNFTSKEDIIKAFYIKQSKEFIDFLKKEETLSVYIVAKTYFTIMGKNLRTLKLLEKNDLLYLLLQFSQPFIYQSFSNNKSTSNNNDYIDLLFPFISGGFWSLSIAWIKDGAVKTPDEMATFISTVLNDDILFVR